MAEKLLELKHITKTFNPDTPNENTVLKGIDLTINNGDFISVIGGNGAGKSTLLNAIAGNVRLSSGRIYLAEADITKESDVKRSSQIARVFQDPLMGTAPRMTVAENLAIALNRGERRRFNRTLNQKTYEAFGERLAKAGLGLENKLDDEVGSLSGGQRQVIALIMATLKKPKLLLLDEHVAALDPSTSQKVMTLTQNLVTEQKITTLMITHNMAYALEYGNRLVMMDQGEVIVNVSNPEKSQLDEEAVLNLFKQESKEFELSDKMFLH